ncbi:MAG: SDR family oxidoreductase [Epsilonproteobacteria bacterium]|nr:SDR family oxidoreductase [Campylobacterota bacterium]
MPTRALVTGGNKGIGLEVTKTFLSKGFEVIVVARDFSSFTIEDENLTTITYDLANVTDLPTLIDQVGDIDILINNAGFMQPKYSYDNYPVEAKERIMNVDLYTPVELMTLCSKSMKEKGSGRIVNVASIAGQIGHPDIWYGIAKAGLINATKIYAKLLGGDGIVVNCIAPSPVETDMQNDNSEERKAEFKKTVVSGRFALASEISKTIVWLAIDCPEYINGTTTDINNCSYPR